MCPIESGRCEGLRDSPDDVRSSATDIPGGVLCCPECGARFHLVREGDMESAICNDRPNWSPTASIVVGPPSRLETSEQGEQLGPVEGEGKADSLDLELIQPLLEFAASPDFALSWEAFEAVGSPRGRRKLELCEMLDEDIDESESDPIDLDWILRTPTQFPCRAFCDVDAMDTMLSRDPIPDRPALPPSVRLSRDSGATRRRSSAPPVSTENAFVALLASVDPWSKSATSGPTSTSNRSHVAEHEVSAYPYVQPELQMIDPPGCAAESSHEDERSRQRGNATLNQADKPNPLRWFARGQVGLALSLVVLAGIAFIGHESRTGAKGVLDSRSKPTLDSNIMRSTLDVQLGPEEVRFVGPSTEPYRDKSAPREIFAGEAVLTDSGSAQPPTQADYWQTEDKSDSLLARDPLAPPHQLSPGPHDEVNSSGD
jgi:hypothetical protein